MLFAIIDLFHSGDYLPYMRLFLGEEDSAIVNLILTFKESF